MKVFIDSDVILDVLLERSLYKNSQLLFELIETKVFVAYTSPIILSNIFYILSKMRNKKIALMAIRKIRLLFKISPVKQSTVDLALSSHFTDFEDALQYYSALKSNCKYLVTRNKKDYVETEVTIVSPEEMLALLSEQE